ncbi:MAG: SDR family oxidoreductase [Bacteroidota bacterium]
MKILLTGASGYIGSHLLHVLLEGGHDVYCAGRSPVKLADRYKNCHFVVHDFSKSDVLQDVPENLDVAYYLMHSMKGKVKGFDEMEARVAENFVRAVNALHVTQIIYLSGLTHTKDLSPHFESRYKVEEILNTSEIPCTVVQASIIIGSGSASFEIIRDLVEKLPVMIAPKWLKTRSQPVSIRDVVYYLDTLKLRREFFDRRLEAAGPDVVSYKELLYAYARVRGLRRWVIIVPVMTPRLSSYWLYFVTSTDYALAVNLVDSMKIESVSKKNRLSRLLEHEPQTLTEALNAALHVEQGELPAYAVYRDKRQKSFPEKNKGVVERRIFALGGDNGWYYANWLWRLRAGIDRLLGGKGMGGGRNVSEPLQPGDTIDFWRVGAASKKEGRLLLKAEMKLPGDAWLEFRLNKSENILYQTAVFRPKGLMGRLYWLLVLPLHAVIFRGLIKKLTEN